MIKTHILRKIRGTFSVPATTLNNPGEIKQIHGPFSVPTTTLKVSLSDLGEHECASSVAIRALHLSRIPAARVPAPRGAA